MFEYRITKYDPRKRDAQDRYLADEWTRYTQVGESIANHVLTMDEYLRTEKAYVDAAMNILAECGVQALVVRSLENGAGNKPVSFGLREGAPVSGDSLREALQSLLREEFWCRLEDDHGSYVHIGWDYYLYNGSTKRPLALASVENARANGLFVEP